MPQGTSLPREFTVVISRESRVFLDNTEKTSRSEGPFCTFSKLRKDTGNEIEAYVGASAKYPDTVSPNHESITSYTYCVIMVRYS